MTCASYAHFTDAGRGLVSRECDWGEVLQTQRLYERFMHRGVREYYQHTFRWPAQYALLGHAVKTDYRSNKSLYGDCKWRDYTHTHGRWWPEVQIVRTQDAALWGEAPPPRSFAILGYALDMEIALPNGQRRNINWLTRGAPAYLCGDKHANRLYIVPLRKDAGYVVTLWSPALQIRDVGITN